MNVLFSLEKGNRGAGRQFHSLHT